MGPLLHEQVFGETMSKNENTLKSLKSEHETIPLQSLRKLNKDNVAVRREEMEDEVSEEPLLVVLSFAVQTALILLNGHRQTRTNLKGIDGSGRMRSLKRLSERERHSRAARFENL